MPEIPPPDMSLLAKAKAFFRKVRGGEQSSTTSRVRILPPETPIRVLHGVSIEQNAHAAQIYIARLRDSNRFHQDPNSRFLIDDRRIRVEPPLEVGYLNAQDLLNTAQNRYQLPMAMYISRAHARLVLKGPYELQNGRTIQIYDPMSAGISEISIPSNLPGTSNGIMANALAQPIIESGRFDISFLDDIQLIEYRESLLNGKLAALQKDSYNCIPYCLFVNALIQGLKPGDTEFKTRGIPQFEQDFGVRILKREELIKPQVKIK